MRTGHGNAEREEVKKFFSQDKFSDSIKIRYIDKLGEELLHDIRVFIGQKWKSRMKKS